MVAFATALTVQAAEKSEDIAKNVAKKYCKNPTLKKTGFAKHSKQGPASSKKVASYYVYTDESSNDFCIVSSNGYDVIAFGKNYAEIFPPQLQDILDDYIPSDSKKIRSELRSATVRENVPYFMDVNYSQGLPYNNQCPVIDSAPAVTGCVATAMAQVMKYWEHPKQLQEDIPAYSLFPRDNKLFGKVHNPAEPAEGRTYNWENILNHYEGDTTDIYVDEVAKLMHDCGRAVEMTYGEHLSGAFDEMYPYALTRYFGYNSDSIQHLMRANYYYDEWEDLLYKEIEKKRPVLFSGSNNDGGHAFVCDGYMDGLFHFNWGWNGVMDGYFDVITLDPYESIGESNGFSKFQVMVTGIVPGKGEKVIEHPIFGRDDENMPDLGESELFTNFKITDDSVLFNVKLFAVDTIFNQNASYSPAYITANGDTLFFQDKINNIDPIHANPMGENDPFLKIQMKRAFDASYKGKELKFVIMESDEKDTIEKDSKTTGWNPSPLFDPITVKIPNSSDTKTENIFIYDIWCKITGDDMNFFGTVYIPRLETGKDYLTLALAVDGDTTLSYGIEEFPWTADQLALDYDIDIDKSYLDEDVYMVVMESDDQENWTMCSRYAPTKIRPSELKVRSSSFIINSLSIDSVNGSYFIDMDLTNPTNYEVETDIIYEWVMEQDHINKMIPSNKKINARAKLHVPFFVDETEYEVLLYNDDLGIDESLILELNMDNHIKCDYSYIGDRLNITFSNQGSNHFQKDFIVDKLDLIDSTWMFRGTLDLEAGTDTTIEVKLDFEMQKGNSIQNPIFVLNDEYGDFCTSFIPDLYLNISYFISLDSEEKRIGLFGESENETDVILAFTTSLDNDAITEYAKIHVEPEDDLIMDDIAYSDYFKLENPAYMCLCNADSSFSIITALNNQNDSAPNVTAVSNLSVVTVDGGVWITSDVDMPSLPIITIDGKRVATVKISSDSSTFVPLDKNVYIVGDKKVLIK